MPQEAAFSESLKALEATVNTTNALLGSLQDIGHGDQPSISTDATINALDLAYDTTSLIKAHSAKLSLLIINEPFTPTAVIKILRELTAGPIPGLASAVEICNAERYTKAMAEELHWRANKVFSELGTLVKAIPLDGRKLDDQQKEGGRGSLAATGVLWDACDAVIALKNLGIMEILVKKVEEYQALVKDALEELREWGDEAAEEADNLQDDEQDVDDAQAAFDDMLGSQKHIPTDDPDQIRERLESTLKKLRLIILMYQAVVKRRLKTLPSMPHLLLPPNLEDQSAPGIIKCLDELMRLLREIPDVVDDLASAFYDLDGVEIDSKMNECFLAGSSAAILLRKNWVDEEDEYTAWVGQQLHHEHPVTKHPRRINFSLPCNKARSASDKLQTIPVLGYNVLRPAHEQEQGLVK